MVSKVFVPESNSLTEEAQKELAELGEETDDYVVATKAKKQQIIKDYTAVPSNNGKGVDILDENGNYRNTYSILKDISEIYSEIQKQDKAMGTNRAQALIEELAGKNRSNILSSLLTNGSLLEQVKETSEHSDNSALEENQKYLESTEAKIAQLQTQLQELATVTINSDMFKGVIDTATAFLNIVTQILDKLPLLSTAIGGLAGFKLSKAGLGKQLNIKLVSI
jgi:TP901 family phage tail tape measure protein